MSVINRMLQDLDRRSAASRPDAGVLKEVRIVERPGGGREWFWRTLAALLLVALAWGAWLLYNLVAPQPLVTDLAYRAAEKARRAPSAPGTQVVAAAPAPAASPAPAAATPAPLGEPFRLAFAIETPISARRASPAVQPVRAEPRAAKAAKREAAAAPAPEAMAQVERRDRIPEPAERAEMEFRRAADLLKRGRQSDAETALAAALQHFDRHRASRQALAALRLERGDLAGAARLIEEGLALDPADTDFAMALARIQVEQKDVAGSLATLDAAAAGASASAEFHALRGAVLQRLGRHADASEAYRSSLRLQPAVPQSWIGLGISLEALERRPEAAEAFKRSLAAGPMSAELKAFAERRARALR